MNIGEMISPDLKLYEIRFGFISERVADAAFILKQIQEHYQASNGRLFVCFSVLEKHFMQFQ